MNESAVEFAVEVEHDLAWAENFLRVIQGIRHTNEAKIRTINLLVKEEAQIQESSRELT